VVLGISPGSIASPPVADISEGQCRAVVEAIRREEFGIGVELRGAPSKQKKACWMDHGIAEDIAGTLTG
jgi:hypothetical protein